jgi:hypothetical protein
VIVVSVVCGSAYAQGGTSDRDFVLGEVNWAVVPRTVTLRVHGNQYGSSVLLLSAPCVANWLRGNPLGKTQYVVAEV